MATLKPIWIRSKCVSLQKFDIKSLICFHDKAAVATHKKRLISVERSHFWRFYLANTKGSFNECKQIIHEIDGGTNYSIENPCEFRVFSNNNLNMRSSLWTIIFRRLHRNKRILIEATQSPLMLSAVSIKLSCLVYTQFRVIMRLARSYQRSMKSFKRTQFRSPFLPLRSNDESLSDISKRVHFKRCCFSSLASRSWKVKKVRWGDSEWHHGNSG